jgi:hypothetical protein
VQAAADDLNAALACAAARRNCSNCGNNLVVMLSSGFQAENIWTAMTGDINIDLFCIFQIE